MFHSGGFSRKPFLEVKIEDFQKGWDVSLYVSKTANKIIDVFELTFHERRGAVLFSQATLPLLLRGINQNPTHPPSLIFTGATASVKANALMVSVHFLIITDRKL